MADPVGLIGASGGVQPAQPIRPAGAPGQRGAGAADAPSFKDLLMENLAEVNRLQRDAAQAAEDLAAGRRADLENVLTATRKADLAFQMLQQVRNRVLDAYDELKQIRV